MLSKEKLEWMESVGIKPITPEIRVRLGRYHDKEITGIFSYIKEYNHDHYVYTTRHLEELSLEKLKQRHERTFTGQSRWRNLV